jgi:hypothetical protein
MARNLTQRQKIQRLKDLQEVQNVMSRYEYYHVANMKEEMIDLFARRTAGVSSGNVNTVSVGFDNVARFMRSVGGGGDNIGSLNLHALTTPVIEVAADGKTAQGIWISPGAEASARGGKLSSTWTLIKIGADFVKEDGVWKLWHYHRFDIFSVPYGQSWAGAGESAGQPAMVPPAGTSPSRYSWAYRTTVRAENVPAPPEPYDTWDESRSMARYQLQGPRGS